MNVPFGSVGFALFFVLELALLESGLDEFAFAMAADEKILGKRIDRLGADAVQADAELEDIVVVFRAGIDLGNAIDDFAQRNAAAEIAHGHRVVLDRDLDLLAVAHDEFIDGVIDDLLEQDVAAIVVMGAVADAADVHAGAQPDVLERGERFDFALVVNVLLGFSHGTQFRVLYGTKKEWNKGRRRSMHGTPGLRRSLRGMFETRTIATQNRCSANRSERKREQGADWTLRDVLIQKDV